MASWKKRLAPKTDKQIKLYQMTYGYEEQYCNKSSLKNYPVQNMSFFLFLSIIGNKV